jgi:REP element-mobilizing transposase RayT
MRTTGSIATRWPKTPPGRVEVWGWVLIPNHVHLILTPSDPDGLRRCRKPRSDKSSLSP